MIIALIQNKWKNTPKETLEYLINKIDETLKDKKIDFLILPEFFMGPPWFQPGQAHFKGITDDTIPGKVTDIFCDIAKKYTTNIIMGSIIERRGQQYYNTSVLIDRNGKIIGLTSKVHTFAGERVACEAATDINVHDSEFGKIGIAVCSDFWIVEYMKILILKGAKIIFIPGGTLGQNIEPMLEALKAIAYLTSTIIVYCSPIGDVIGYRNNSKICLNYRGCSLISTPEKIIYQASENQEEVALIELEDNFIDEFRENSIQWKRILSANQKSFKDILKDYEEELSDLSKLMEDRMSNDYKKKVHNVGGANEDIIYKINN